MFTSRAEYRLLFNHGSAEFRYLEHAKQFNLLTSSRVSRIENNAKLVDFWSLQLSKLKGSTGLSFAQEIKSKGEGACIFPPDFNVLCPTVKEQVVYNILYDGYLQRELKAAHRLSSIDDIPIPTSFDFQNLPGLRNECIEKLSSIRPSNLGQASRISGVNPSDISILQIYLDRHTKSVSNGRES